MLNIIYYVLFYIVIHSSIIYYIYTVYGKFPLRLEEHPALKIGDRL